MLEDLSVLSKRYRSELNKETDPLFISLCADTREKSASMEFQHFHDFYEIYCILDNSAGVFIEGQYYVVYEGDIVVESPGRLHKGVYFDGVKVRRILLSFRFPQSVIPEDAARNLFRPFHSNVPIFRFKSDVSERLISQLALCLKETEDEKESPETEVLLIGQIMRFLYDFSKTARTEQNEYVNQEFDRISSKVYSISSYIHKHYAEPLTLEMIADKFFISSCYLSRRFKEISGYSITNFIQQTRIKNAQEKLISTNDSIQDICTACGFNSFSQFSRIFRQICGMSPREYRASHQNPEVI